MSTRGFLFIRIFSVNKTSGKPASFKTTETSASTAAFIDALPAGQQRADSRTILKLKKATGSSVKMWGTSISSGKNGPGGNRGLVVIATGRS